LKTVEGSRPPWVRIPPPPHRSTRPARLAIHSLLPVEGCGTIREVRRSLAWVVAVPLMLAGSQVAHVLVYRWVYPSSQVRVHALLSSGHGYMDRLPLLFGVAGAVVLVSLVVGIGDAARGRSARPLPAWAFALLPLTAFSLQEILERSLHTGTFMWQAVESPTFVPGLVLQLPFAAAAFLTARLLLRTASAVARIIAKRRSSHGLRRAPAQVRRPSVVRLPRLAPLAFAAAGRAPPLPVR
jgi:hypothetical protein